MLRAPTEAPRLGQRGVLTVALRLGQPGARIVAPHLGQPGALTVAPLLRLLHQSGLWGTAAGTPLM